MRRHVSGDAEAVTGGGTRAQAEKPSDLAKKSWRTVLRGTVKEFGGPSARLDRGTDLLSLDTAVCWPSSCAARSGFGSGRAWEFEHQAAHGQRGDAGAGPPLATGAAGDQPPAPVGPAARRSTGPSGRRAWRPGDQKAHERGHSADGVGDSAAGPLQPSKRLVHVALDRDRSRSRTHGAVGRPARRRTPGTGTPTPAACDRAAGPAASAARRHVTPLPAALTIAPDSRSPGDRKPGRPAIPPDGPALVSGTWLDLRCSEPGSHVRASGLHAVAFDVQATQVGGIRPLGHPQDGSQLETGVFLMMRRIAAIMVVHLLPSV